MNPTLLLASLAILAVFAILAPRAFLALIVVSVVIYLAAPPGWHDVPPKWKRRD